MISTKTIFVNRYGGPTGSERGTLAQTASRMVPRGHYQIIRPARRRTH